MEDNSHTRAAVARENKSDDTRDIAEPQSGSEDQKIESLLEDIRENTHTPWWRAVVHGSFYGMGVVVGTIVTIALLGWLLSAFGFIPGIGSIAQSLQGTMQSKYQTK